MLSLILFNLLDEQIQNLYWRRFIPKINQKIYTKVQFIKDLFSFRYPSFWVLFFSSGFLHPRELDLGGTVDMKSSFSTLPTHP